MKNDFSKLIWLDELTKHSEPTVRIVRPRDLSVSHVKVASEALDYIKNVQPVPGKTIILVLAMTAGEHYGCNKNGDAWSERPLRVGPSTITENDVLPKHYKSFETDAHVFRHHCNKDPNGSIGEVMRAFYNWPMHRVELLLSLDNNRADEVVQDIERGGYPACSMGCRIKEDVCAICGNPAPSRADYCEHARDMLTQYLPNGKQVFVWNPSPKFFDISMVRRPADRLGFMMKKVADHDVISSAEWGEYVERLSGKLAQARKLSDISKILNGDVVASKDDGGDLDLARRFAREVATPAAASTPPLDDGCIRTMLNHNPAQVLSTLSSLGIFLTTPEFLKFFLWKIDPTLRIPDEYLDNVVASQQHIFDILANNPDLVEEVQKTAFLNVCPENVDAHLKTAFAPLAPKRSMLRKYAEQRLMDWALGRAEVATSLTALPPGRCKTASRWPQKLRGLLGAGALLAGAYKIAESQLDTPTSVMWLAQDRAHVLAPTYRNTATKLADATLNSVASWLGEWICP